MTALASRVASVPTTDADLLAAVARGDLHALGELFTRYEPALRRYLGRLGVLANDADDLIQATFLELPHASEHFDARRNARSWLFGITTMMARRHRRSVRQAAARLAAWAGFARDEAPPYQTADELVEGYRLQTSFRRAFERLSPKRREVFVLVTLEGLTGEEAAHVLGVPVNTVWTRLHHARRELRAAIMEGGP